MKAYFTYLFTLKETIKDKTLKEFMQQYQGLYPWYTPDDAEDLEEIWKRIKEMFNRKGVYFNEIDEDYDLSVQEQYDAYLHRPDTMMRLDDLLATIGDTKAHYIALIENQKDLQNQILNTFVQSESEHYFNDTPQTSGGSINQNFTSTYSKDVTKLNIGPVSNQLEEVRLAMQDYYEQWVKEFRKFILLDKE